MSIMTDKSDFYVQLLITHSTQEVFCQINLTLITMIRVTTFYFTLSKINKKSF